MLLLLGLTWSNLFFICTGCFWIGFAFKLGSVDFEEVFVPVDDESSLGGSDVEFLLELVD